MSEAQSDTLAKLAEIPPAGSEERKVWLVTAHHAGLYASITGEFSTFNPDVVLALMSEARRQGQRDVMEAATAHDDAVDRALDAFFGHLPHPDKPWGSSWRSQMRDALNAALATGGARHG